MLRRLTEPWRIQRAFRIVSLVVAVVLIYTLHATEMPERAAGVYHIAGVEWWWFAVLHVLVWAGFLALHIYDQRKDTELRRLEDLAKNAAVVMVVVGIVDILWLIPNRTVVITI